VTGPCLCGDLYCGSCGPAQGNSRCFGCGEWTLDHAEHEATALDVVKRLARMRGPIAVTSVVELIDEAQGIVACRHDAEKCRAIEAKLCEEEPTP
jgi:hypothetical protein